MIPKKKILLSYGQSFEYACPHAANPHALKSFVSKSKDGLRLIRSLVLEMPFGKDLSAYQSDINGMKAVARQLAKHFVGVMSVCIEIRWVEDLGPNTYVEETVVREEQCKVELARIVRSVLKAKGLKEVMWLEGQKPVFGKLEALVEKVMKEKKIPQNGWVKVLAVEGEKREEVRCDHWDLMREQSANVPT